MRARECSAEPGGFWRNVSNGLPVVTIVLRPVSASAPATPILATHASSPPLADVSKEPAFVGKSVENVNPVT